MGLAGDFLRIDPRHEDWLGWQGQTPGKLQGLRRDSRRTQLGCEDCTGLRGQTAGTRGGARIACEGINVAKVANPGQEIQSLAALSAAKIKLV